MARYSIDLSRLPPPDVVEEPEYETILAELKAYFRGLVADSADYALIDVESDPVIAILEVVAYREMLLRARVNDASRAVLLATATGTDLDHLAALFGVERLLVSEGDAEAIPPVPATYETDAALRKRTQLSLEGFSTAGPEGAYLFHALSHDGRIIDAEIISPSPGEVLVTYYAEENGAQITSLGSGLLAALSADDVRPLTDLVTVAAAVPVTYAITAEIVVRTGPDADVIEAAARVALDDFLRDRKRIGEDHPVSGIYAALHRPGVSEVRLIAPTADVAIAQGQIGLLGTLSLTISEAP